MSKRNYLGKRIVSLMLSLCMVTLNLPMLFQGGTAEAAYTQPTSIAAGFKTKDEVLAYNTAAEDASHKVYFGSLSDNKWWIVGNNGGNLALFNSALLSNSMDYKGASQYDYSDGTKSVPPNHYGASSVRSTLNGYAKNTSYFSTAEQALMKDTELDLYDDGNNRSYSVSDKLYAPYCYFRISAENGSLPIITSYYPEGDVFWTNSNDGDDWHEYVYVGDASSEDGYSSYYVKSNDPNAEKASIAAVTQLDATKLAFAAPKVTEDNKWQEVTEDDTLELKWVDATKVDKSLSIAQDSNGKTVVRYGDGGTGVSGVKFIIMATDHNGKTYIRSSTVATNSWSEIDDRVLKGLDAGLYYCKVWVETTEGNTTYVHSADESGVVGVNYTKTGSQTISLKLDGKSANDENVFYYTFEDNLKITPSLDGAMGSGEITYEITYERNQSGIATLNSDNTISISKVGSFFIVGKIASDGVYDAAQTAWCTVNISQGTQSDIIIKGLKDSYTYGKDNNIKITAEGGNGTGAYVFYTSNSEVATVSTSGNEGTITLNKAGKFTVWANKNGDDNYKKKYGTQSKEITVNPGTQTGFVISAVDSCAYGETGIQVSASGGQSTGAISFESSDPAVATVEDSGNGTASITPVKPGKFTLKATKAADDKYAKAEVSKEITITKGTQGTLSITGLSSSYAYGTQNITAQTTGGSGNGAVTFTTVSGSEYGTISSDGKITLKKAGGSFEIKATKAGDDYYDAKESEKVTITVTKADQAALNITAKSNYYYSDSGKIKLTTTGGSGTGAVTFETVGSKDFGEISSDGTLTFHKAFGSFKVKATKAADTNYNVVTSQEVTIYVDGYEQTGLKITGPNADKNYTFSPNSTIQLKVEGAKDSPKITYSVSSSNNAVSIDQNTGLVTMHKAGTFTVTANLQKTTGYAAATVSETFTINKLDITEGIKATIKEVTHAYDGKAWDPTSKIEVKYGDTILANGTDYKVTLPKDMTSLGQKEITITLTHNDYTGTAKVYGEIIPDPDVYGVGATVGNTGIINYVSSNGTTSAVVNPNGMTWLKEESGGSSAWYGIDNSENIFPENSMFYVRWLSEEDGEDYIKYYNQIDHRYIKEVESGRIYIFLVGVRNLATGEEITNFNGKELNLLIQIGEDWDKDDIQAVFIEDNANEIIGSSYKSAEYPGGTGDFASLTLNHFSPYIVYDKLTEQDQNQNNPSDNTNNNDKNQTNNANDNEGSTTGTGYVLSGDTSYKAIAWFAGLALASGCTALVLGKKRRKDS